MTPQEIREIRQALGISQERFASILGTTVVTVNRWENGKTTPSRLYIRELKEVRNGTYIRGRKEFKEP